MKKDKKQKKKKKHKASSSSSSSEDEWVERTSKFYPSYCEWQGKEGCQIIL